MPAEQECPDCGKPMDEAYAYISGVCPTHGVRVVNLALAELQAAQDALQSIENMAGSGGAGEIPAMPIAAAARAGLAAQRTEEPSE